jgi:hypothetical protein
MKISAELQKRIKINKMNIKLALHDLLSLYNNDEEDLTMEEKEEVISEIDNGYPFSESIDELICHMESWFTGIIPEKRREYKLTEKEIKILADILGTLTLGTCEKLHIDNELRNEGFKLYDRIKSVREGK